MSITIPTLAALEQSIGAYFLTAFPAADHGPYSYFGQRARTLAGILLGLYQSVQDADRDAIPSSSTSSGRLDEFAILFGLSNGAGGYGRKGAVAATGGTASISYTGASGTPYTLPTSQTFLAADGSTVLTVATAEVYASAGTQTVDINATTPGTVGNLPIGARLALQSPPAGFPAAVVLSGPLSGGVDKETDQALLERILYRLQNPPRAITASDLRQLAEGADPSVADAYVYPLRSGTGTADVAPMRSGSGSSRRPSVDLVTKVQAYLDDMRNVTATVTTLRVTDSAGLAVDVRAEAAPSSPWDWNATAAWSGTVDTYPVAADPLKLKLSTTAPADLKAAIGVSNAASRPRLQIPVAGTTLPIIVQATAFADSGGKTTLTLAEAPAVAPVGGEAVYAASAWAADIEEAILSYVDSELGPSRVSGFADPGRYWDDTLRIDALRWLTLDAADSTGARYIAKLTAVTIDGGTSDVQATDPGGASPPEYLTLSSVVVRP